MSYKRWLAVLLVISLFLVACSSQDASDSGTSSSDSGSAGSGTIDSSASGSASSDLPSTQIPPEGCPTLCQEGKGWCSEGDFYYCAVDSKGCTSIEKIEACGTCQDQIWCNDGDTKKGIFSVDDFHKYTPVQGEVGEEFKMILPEGEMMCEVTRNVGGQVIFACS